VLCGASAVELYTGGLWPAGDVEVLTTETRPLVAELFAAGFRWTQRPRDVGRGLWHPELQIGIDVLEAPESPGPAVLSNILSLAVDLEATGPADKNLVSLKVVGIEDLIVEQVACWLKHPTGEAATRIQVLTGLARRGVGGWLRAGYLQRRLAWETNGEVAFEAEGGTEDDTTPRMMTLSQMRALIGAWRIRCGFSFDQPSPRVARRSRESRTDAIGYPNDRWAVGSRVVAANVIPFDVAPTEPRG
jgi:hypothetical protein